MFNIESFDNMFDEMRSMQGFMPAVDVFEKGSNVIVEMSIPHIDPEKVDISIENNVLHVKGSTSKKTELEDKNYFRREMRSGSFYRTIPLPVEVLADKTSAVHEDGVLKISLPKAKEDKAKSVKVKVNKK